MFKQNYLKHASSGVLQITAKLGQVTLKYYVLKFTDFRNTEELPQRYQKSGIIIVKGGDKTNNNNCVVMLFLSM